MNAVLVQECMPLPIRARLSPVRALIIDVFPDWVFPNSQKTGVGMDDFMASSRSFISSSSRRGGKDSRVNFFPHIQSLKQGCNNL